MINSSIINIIFSSASIQRWNDYPRMMELVELDKQAHKFVIAYFIAKLEKNVNYTQLIEAGIFEFFRRVIVTDIRPDVFHKALQQKSHEINQWVLDKLENSFIDTDNGKFFKKFKKYLNDETMYQKERYILKAASYLSTAWEFKIIYQTSSFLNDIEDVKKRVEEELEDYYELIGVRKIALNQKLAKLVDLSGRLRFQKRWAQTPRIPKTSVLGHMFTVAIFGYFYSIKINTCDKRLENNFFTALFHDLPEALTRDIISPVKYSVNDLASIIGEFEITKINDEILPNIPNNLKKEFSYLLGLYNGTKDEFLDKIIYKNNIKIIDPKIDNLNNYNENQYSAIDGLALKQCDRLSAFVEASLSISHGITSTELSRGRIEIMKKFQKINGIDFKEIAKNLNFD